MNGAYKNREIAERIWSVNHDKHSPNAKMMEFDKDRCLQTIFMGYLNYSRVSTVFSGSGTAHFSFGNCNNKGETNMYLNNKKIKQVKSNGMVPVIFSFKPRDTLHIEGAEGGKVLVDYIYIKCRGKNMFFIIF